MRILGLDTFISTFSKIFSSPPYKSSPPHITIVKNEVKENKAADLIKKN
jgi:hypothetical protein